MSRFPCDSEGGKLFNSNKLQFNIETRAISSKVTMRADLDIVSQTFASGDKPEQMRDMRKLLAFLFRERKSRSADPCFGK
jgi:hypothetical protein